MSAILKIDKQMILKFTLLDLLTPNRFRNNNAQGFVGKLTTRNIAENVNFFI